MSWLRDWGLTLGLLGLALGLGLFAGAGSLEADDPTPSVHNPGPRGLEVLRTWLAEAGAPVRALEGPLTALPGDLAALVLAAPRARALSEAELDAVKAFVAGGGTLVWLVPPDGLGAQARLGEWLGPRRGALLGPLIGDDALADPGGRTVRVTAQVGLTAGVERLRLAAGPGLDFADPAMVPLAEGGALWARPFGKGEIWAAAGPELGEARRLELEGNARFWANLAARGPLAFDEHHHLAVRGPPLTANLPASLGQLALLAVAFAWVAGRRLGPPRPAVREVHRSALEYVDALAALTARAHVEGELCAELHARLRRVLFERLGAPLALADEEAAREAEAHLGLPRAQVEGVLRALRNAGPRTSAAVFARLAREAAVLERAVLLGGPAGRWPQ